MPCLSCAVQFRIGAVSDAALLSGSKVKGLYECFPNVVARAKKAGADPLDLVQGAT